MEELINKPLELLWYVSYIEDDKVKIQCFLGCLPSSYKDHSFKNWIDRFRNWPVHRFGTRPGQTGR